MISESNWTVGGVLQGQAGEPPEGLEGEQEKQSHEQDGDHVL